MEMLPLRTVYGRIGKLISIIVTITLLSCNPQRTILRDSYILVKTLLDDFYVTNLD